MLASTVQFSKNNQNSLRYCGCLSTSLGRWFIRGREPITERHKACSLRTQQRTDQSSWPSRHLSTRQAAVLTVETTENQASQHPLVSTTPLKRVWVCLPLRRSLRSTRSAP